MKHTGRPEWILLRCHLLALGFASLLFGALQKVRPYPAKDQRKNKFGPPRLNEVMKVIINRLFHFLKLNKEDSVLKSLPRIFNNIPVYSFCFRAENIPFSALYTWYST